MNSLYQAVFHWGYMFAKAYWFLFRPKALGTKCVVVCGGEVLLIRNSYGPIGWTLPGGGVKKGEELEAAARRELFEEVGVEAASADYIGNTLLIQEYKKDMVHVFSFAVVDKPGVVIDNREVVEARWFSLDNLPALTPSGSYALKLYRHAD